MIQGAGRVGMNGGLNLKTKLKLTPALAEKMILKQPKLQLLADSEGNIVIPVVVRKEKHILVLPDVSDLAKRAAQNTAKEAVKKELDKLGPGLGNALDSLFK